MINIFNIKDKNILITGASSGFGQHIAEFYASHGANVIICARRAERLEQLKAQLQAKYSVSVYIYALDVNNRKAIKDMLDHLDEQKIRIDVLVNNAGVGANNRFLDTTEQEWDNVISTNLKAPWLCSQEIVKHMIEHKIEGSIINITSVLSKS